MSREAIRYAITAKVMNLVNSSPNPNLVVEFDNEALVDTKTQQTPFMCVRIKLFDAEQVDLATNPRHRFHGQIELAVAIPKASGSRAALELLDYYYPKLHKTRFSGVRTYMATTAPDKEHLEWMYYCMAIPFWYDQVEA